MNPPLEAIPALSGDKPLLGHLLEVRRRFAPYRERFAEWLP